VVPTIKKVDVPLKRGRLGGELVENRLNNNQMMRKEEGKKGPKRKVPKIPKWKWGGGKPEIHRGSPPRCAPELKGDNRPKGVSCASRFWGD